MSSQKFGIPVQVTLDKTRVIAKFGRNVENIFLSHPLNKDVVVEIAAYNSSFYAPIYGGGAHGNRQEVHSPSYFYMICSRTNFIDVILGHYSTQTGPFRAPRGLVLKRNPGVFATVILEGVEEGDSERGKA